MNPIIRTIAVGVFWLLVAAPASPTGVAARNFVLTIGGQQAGYLSSFKGGNAVGEVVKVTGPTSIAKKHLANIHYEPITIEVGIGMSKPLSDWLVSMLRGTQAPTNGAVLVLDSQMKVVQELNFSAALITSVSFPKLDGSSKDAARVTLEITPNTVVTTKGSGAVVTTPSVKQKSSLESSFRFELDGLDTKRVTKIEAFTIKQKLLTEAVGGMRETIPKPGELEIPNIRVSFSAASLEPWTRWFEEFVLRGINDDRHEKQGRIVLLGPNLKDELLTLTLSNIGIFALREYQAAANNDAIGPVEADLYIERMELSAKP